MRDIHVSESRFGKWFLATDTWAVHVLDRAIKDLIRLAGDRLPRRPAIVDVGCGWGHGLRLLDRYFEPARLVGIDVDRAMITASAAEAARNRLDVELINGTGSRLPLRSRSVDMVFCHQTFHHLVDQESAVREFYRVLRPSGLLLFAESTRAYIDSWIIRLLFRHPLHVQKTAPEYVAMIRKNGFVVTPDSVSLPYLWWSRPDLGLLENLFGFAPPAKREETLVNLVAVRP